MIGQAVLLLGGRGTRLWPLTATLPKGLLPVAGLPFVEYQLRLLTEAGVEQAFLAIGKDHEPAWRSFVEGHIGPPSLELAVEDEALDTAGPVVALIDRLDESFWVLNGDVLVEAALAGLAGEAPLAGGMLALARVNDPSGFGVVVVGSDHQVERFVEKPPPETAPADTVSAGVYLLRREALAGFGPGPVSFERQVFPRLVSQGRLRAVVTEGLWLDMGGPGLYLAAHAAVLGGECRLYRPDQLHGRGGGSVVAGTLGGEWSWVGEGVVVDEGAHLEEAVVLDGAHLHSGARVVGAVVGWGAQVLPGATVTGQALIGEGCEIGADCELDRGARVAPGTRLGLRAISFSPPP